jgi:two-component system, LuxR family, response regulator FixJ
VHGDTTTIRENESPQLEAEHRLDSPLIAIVDDDASFRRAIGRLLRLAGFRTWTFASAEEYLRIGVPNDCLILDLHLEGMSGLELQLLLRTQGNDVPIVFVTATNDPNARRRALDGGAVAYLQKPFEEYWLLEVLQAVTGYREA